MTDVIPIDGPDNLALVLHNNLPEDYTIEVPRSAGGCPAHGRQWLRLGIKGQGRGKPSKQVWICTYGTIHEPLICGVVKEESRRIDDRR